MPAIKKSDVLDDSVKKAFEDLNTAVKTSVDLLVMMTKSAKDVNSSLGSGTNITQLTAANTQYTQHMKDQIKIQTDLVKLERQRLALAEAQKKAAAAAANSTVINNNAQAQSAANLAAANARAQAAQTRAQTAAAAAQRQQATAAAAAQRAAAQAARNSTLYAQEQQRLNQLRDAARQAALQYGVNSREAKRLAKEVQALDGRLRGLDASLGQHQRNVGNYSGALRDLGTGLLGGFGITLGISAVAAGIMDVVKSSIAFEKALSSLRAITGASAKDLEFYRQKAIAMSSSTTKGAIEIVKAFESVGSKSPDLLKNKEALASVTEEVIRLSESSGGMLDMAGSVDAVTAAINVYGISALEAGRITNTFAAGSKEGSAEVSTLTEAFKTGGTVMHGANMTLEQSVAMLEVLGEKAIYGAEAGTKLKGSILRLQAAGKGYASGKFNLKDALEEVNTELAKQGTELEKDALKTKLFGAENITVGSIMLANVDKYDKLTTAVTGTTTAVEQQKIQNDNLSGSVTKLGNVWDSWMLSLNKSNGILKKTIDLITDAIRSFSFQGMDDAGKAAELANREFSKLNETLSALTIKDQIHTIEADLKRMNTKLKEAKDEAAKEGLNIESGVFDIKNTAFAVGGITAGIKTVYSVMTDEELTSAKIRYKSQQEYTKLMQDRLNALYAEQMKQEDGIDLTKTATEETEKGNDAKNATIKATADLIKIQEELLSKKQAEEATTEQEIINRRFAINVIEDEIKRLKELGTIKEIEPIDVSKLEADMEAIGESVGAMEDEYLQKFFDDEEEKTRKLEEEEQKRAEIRERWADTVSEGISAVEDTIWDNLATSREDAMNAEIEAMNERLENENLDDEQRQEIQKQIDEREKKLKTKNAKAEKQDAINRVVIDTIAGVAKLKIQAAIWTAAMNYPAAAIALAEIPFVAASGTIQAAAIAMRKIPEYAEGIENHSGGLAVVGDGGKSELVETPSGAMYMTPDKSTLVNLEKGSRVTPGDEVANRLTELSRQEIVNMAIPASVDYVQRGLINKMISEQMKTTDAVKSIKTPTFPDMSSLVKHEIFKSKLKN